VDHGPEHIYGFFAGNKISGFLTPPTQNETSSQKSSSIFVKSDGIAQLMPFIRNAFMR
jgi:hypothetical protein